MSLPNKHEGIVFYYKHRVSTMVNRHLLAYGFTYLNVSFWSRVGCGGCVFYGLEVL